MKILIVDDEQDARRLLRAIGERAYHQVMEAENGEEGLKLAMENRPDLIISDALMPVMDGFHLLREIKKDPSLKHIPFVFYSATYTEDEDVRLALAMGADDYIVKPQEPEELWAEIGRALERHKQEGGLNVPATTPEEENDSAPGRFFASSTKSFTVFHGLSARTASTVGSAEISATGASWLIW